MDSLNDILEILEGPDEKRKTSQKNKNNKPFNTCNKKPNKIHPSLTSEHLFTIFLQDIRLSQRSETKQAGSSPPNRPAYSFSSPIAKIES